MIPVLFLGYFSEVTGKAGTWGLPVDTCSGLSTPPRPVCFLHGMQGLGPSGLLSAQPTGTGSANVQQMVGLGEAGEG